MKIDWATIHATAKVLRTEAARRWKCEAREIDYPSCVSMAIKGEVIPQEEVKVGYAERLQVVVKNFAPLVGSEKQVKWATEIRDGRAWTLGNRLERADGVISRNGANTSAELIADYDKLLALAQNLSTKTEAAWWIETRNVELEKLDASLSAIPENKTREQIEEEKFRNQVNTDMARRGIGFRQ